jgi:predicted O-methyltransferase YrrM
LGEDLLRGLDMFLENDLYQNFAKDCGQKFDFIIIDSLKRFQCAKNSISALKPGGTIILDDSERKNYQKIFDFLTTDAWSN